MTSEQEGSARDAMHLPAGRMQALTRDWWALGAGEVLFFLQDGR